MGSDAGADEVSLIVSNNGKIERVGEQFQFDLIIN